MVMIFDLWVSVLEKEVYLKFSWDYLKKIFKEFKKCYVYILVIFFFKGIGVYLDSIDGEFDVFGVDWGMFLEVVKKILGGKYVL